MHDLMIALGQPVAQHLGVGRVEELDCETVLGEQVLVLGREDREVGQAREHHDLDRGLGGRRGGHRQQRRAECSEQYVLSWHLESLTPRP